MTDSTPKPASDGQTESEITSDASSQEAHLTDEKTGKSGGSSKKILGAGSVTAAVVALFLFVRILAVSHWNWNVASDIADSFNFDDAISILFGTLFEMPIVSGIIISVVLPLAIFRLFWLTRHADRVSNLTDVFVIITLGITLFVLIRSYGMWWPLAIVFAVTGSLIVAALLPESARTRKILSKVGRNAGTLMVASFLLLAVLINTPWIPREQIETDDGKIYGYVLQENAGFIKVLTDDHDVVFVKVDNIEARTAAPKE